MRHRRGITSLLAVLAIMVVSLAAGCGRGGAQPRPAGQPSEPPAPRYYLALGDSLAQGVQPATTGQSRPTNAGYPDRIYSALRARQRGWHLVKLGCSGETTQTMIRGGTCGYPAGSQLAQAERFLRTHRRHIGLVTIDIGANDPNSCVLGGASLRRLPACMDTSVRRTTADLRTILAGLRRAGGPTATIEAMSYYVPELAGWLRGFTGKEIAVLTERLVASLNQLLDRIYRQYGARVANVFSAFHSADFTAKVHVPGHGVLPRNVAIVCQWTWACASPPRGPNEHANAAGYRAIARAFLHADPGLVRG
jgi:lysophospholipase L1-like esterase